MSSIKTEVIVT